MGFSETKRFAENDTRLKPLSILKHQTHKDLDYNDRQAKFNNCGVFPIKVVSSLPSPFCISEWNTRLQSTAKFIICWLDTIFNEIRLQNCLNCLIVYVWRLNLICLVLMIRGFLLKHLIQFRWWCKLKFSFIGYIDLKGIKEKHSAQNA